MAAALLVGTLRRLSLMNLYCERLRLGLMSTHVAARGNLLMRSKPDLPY
jgi:hypothetical protein